MSTDSETEMESHNIYKIDRAVAKRNKVSIAFSVTI